MRTKTDIRFVVDADPDQVMDALAAVESLPEWSNSYLDARVASRDDQGRPRRVFVKAELIGGSDLQVLEYDWTDSRSAWEVTDSTRGVKGGGWFEISDGKDGTDVWYHVELYLPIPVPGLLVSRTLRRSNEEVVANFIDFAERFSETETIEAG
ncbi:MULTISPECIES: SRPBCC family protein [unclassified Nocardia]|uniref:SRPBCC family protein n=1 Tax=unclassified Nocardia TaxID=2637762 RepID=UPI002E1D64D3|nr:SRPBCC family protein [Nocardia sp. NBC_01009]